VRDGHCSGATCDRHRQHQFEGRRVLILQEGRRPCRIHNSCGGHVLPQPRDDAGLSWAEPAQCTCDMHSCASRLYPGMSFCSRVCGCFYLPHNGSRHTAYTGVHCRRSIHHSQLAPIHARTHTHIRTTRTTDTLHEYTEHATAQVCKCSHTYTHTYIHTYIHTHTLQLHCLAPLPLSPSHIFAVESAGPFRDMPADVESVGTGSRQLLCRSFGCSHPLTTPVRRLRRKILHQQETWQGMQLALPATQNWPFAIVHERLRGLPCRFFSGRRSLPSLGKRHQSCDTSPPF